MGQSYSSYALWASQNIFAGNYLFEFFQIWPYPQHEPMVAAPPGRRPSRQAHGSTASNSPSSPAPCVVPMILSRIGQHIKDEPCAKHRALLGVLSSRFSSVSRGVRSAAPILIRSPLVVHAHSSVHYSTYYLYYLVQL